MGTLVDHHPQVHRRRAAPRRREEGRRSAHPREDKMPWQTAPGVIIIIAAFSVSGLLIPPIHQLFKGKKRVIGRDDFDFMMERRDNKLKELAAKTAAAQ